MLSKVHRTLCTILSCLLVLTPALAAQQTSTDAAPIPPQLLKAHTVFVSNGGGSNYFDALDGGANRAYNTFYKELQQTKVYMLVSSPAQADIIFQIHAIAPAVSGPNDLELYNPQVILRVLDPKTNAVLWTESANVNAYGTKSRRDRQFDQSVSVLVDKLAQVTGQPLTQAQTTAISDNSSTKIPTAKKIFFVVGIALGAVILGLGIHMATHPPKPPPLPVLPPTPTPVYP